MSDGLQRPGQPSRNLLIRQRAQQGDLFSPPTVPGRVGDTQLFSLLPHGAGAPAGAARDLLIGEGAEQGDVGRRPQRPVIPQDEVAGQPLLGVDLAALLALLLGPLAGLDRFGPLLRGYSSGRSRQ
ncbi:MAG TPA: hypothetical protein VFW33_18835 [Gemmataceae bacterium]|nr:hypothetical protein [Gemmataceae bacterium]